MATVPFTRPVAESVAKINDEVAIGEDLGFQRRWWRFERIERSGTPSMMNVHLAGAAVRGGFVELSLSDTAVSGFGLRLVIPAPESTTVGARELTYRFPANQSAAFLRFEFEPDAAGIYPLTIGVSGKSLRLRVAVMP